MQYFCSLGRDLRDLGARHRQSRDRLRLERERLRRPGRVAERVGRRNRALLDAEDRFAGQPVEEEQQADLRHLHDGRNLLAVAIDLGEHRRRVEIAVVDVVVRRLVVPPVFAGRGVERDHAGRIEVGARPAVAVVLIDGVAERDEDQAVLVVDRQRLPRARALAVLPTVQSPRAEVRIARLRHGVEAPHFLAGQQIEAAEIAGNAPPIVLARAAGKDREVLVDRHRRRDRVRLAVRECGSMMPFSRSTTPTSGTSVPVFASSWTSLPALSVTSTRGACGGVPGQ